MPVRFDALFSERVIEAKLDCLFKDRLLYWNAMIANNDSLSAGLARRE